MDSSCSSLLTDDNEEVRSVDFDDGKKFHGIFSLQAISTLTSKSSSFDRREIYLPNSTIFVIAVRADRLIDQWEMFSLSLVV